VSDVPLRLPNAAVRFPLRAAAFFLLFCLFVLFYIDPARIYYSYWLSAPFPVFKTGWAFLREYVTEPGKPAQYGAAFLSQLYAVSWLGALVVTSVAGLLCLGAWFYVARLNGRRPAVAHYVPALVLLLFYNVYQDPMPAALGLTVAVGCACAYAAMRARGRWARSVAFLGLFGTSYYLAGGASLIFAWLCVAFAVGAERRPLAGAAYAAVAGVGPYLVGKVILRLRITDAYFRLWFFHQDSDVQQVWLGAALYASVVVLPVWVCVWPWLRTQLPSVAARLRMSALAAPVGLLARGNLGRVALGVAPFVLGVAAIWGSHDGETRTVYKVQCYAEHKDWANLLRAVREHRWERWFYFINWDVNRALYHSNLMPDRMFAYPQDVGGLLSDLTSFRKGQVMTPTWVRMSDVLWDLGRVNEAQHMAYEALDAIGDHPLVLKRLALMAVAKREPETARIVLGALRRDLWSGRWATQYLKRLEADPSASFDDEIQRVRALMVDEDLLGWQRPEDMLRQSLARNPHNRMAFEYFMSDCLLRANLQPLAANIGRLKDFSYPTRPRCYDEALLLYARTSTAEGYIYEPSISDQTKRRYQEFMDAVRRAGPDSGRAVRALAKEFGDTYFYYHTFGVAGLGR
jgi:hypothetical protein